MALIGDDITADDVETQEDFYTYYGSAPVVAWVLNMSIKDDPKVSARIAAHHQVFTFTGKEGSKAESLSNATQWGTALHDAKLKDDVAKAFAKFDKDDSGLISITEIRAIFLESNVMDEDIIELIVK